MRIIYVPQFPTEMRYQLWWASKIPEEFIKSGHEVIILGKEYINMIKHKQSSIEMFSPINVAIELECEQIKEYMNMSIRNGDVLFLSDLSFPGFFANALYHKQCSKMFCFCHATSINKFDYFSNVSYSKFDVESAHSELFNKIFIGSYYHEKKLTNNYNYDEYSSYWRNCIVTYLPFPPFKSSLISEKKYNIMSASRPTPQKVDLKLENEVEKIFGIIYRPISNSWQEYYDNLSQSKILLISAVEDTFGYQIVDAIMNGCIPIARNDLAYPELLSEEYLYNNIDELVDKINKILNSDDFLPVPKLLCENQMNNFYKNIIKEMET